MILGQSLRLWGVDGVKDGKSFKNLHKLRFLELPAAKSRFSKKISKIWSRVFCIRVLRAIMRNLSQIGLILNKGGWRTGFARLAFYLCFGIWPNLNPCILKQRKDVKNLVNSFLYFVLRAIMPNLSKIGLILDKGGGGRTGFARSALLEIPRFDISRPSPRRSVRGVAQNNSRWKPFLPSLQRWKPHDAIFLSSREIKVFL